MRIQTGVDGVKRSKVVLDKLAAESYTAIAKGLLYEAEATMADSKENYVPVRSGTLRASGHVYPPRKEGQKWIIELAYGDAAAWYAVIVHERPMVNPQRWGRTASGRRGQNKYLEKPFFAHGRNLDKRLAAWVAFLKKKG